MNAAIHALVPAHIDEADWIPEGEGKWALPLYFLSDNRGWVELMRLRPGTRLGLHRHSGEVHAFNLRGSRRLCSGELVGPGDYVHEPAGNVDWWEACGEEELIVFVVVHGSVEYLDARGGVARSISTVDRIQSYLEHCRHQRRTPRVPLAA